MALAELQRVAETVRGLHVSGSLPVKIMGVYAFSTAHTPGVRRSPLLARLSAESIIVVVTGAGGSLADAHVPRYAEFREHCETLRQKMKDAECDAVIDGTPPEVLAHKHAECIAALMQCNVLYKQWLKGVNAQQFLVQGRQSAGRQSAGRQSAGRRSVGAGGWPWEEEHVLRRQILGSYLGTRIDFPTILPQLLIVQGALQTGVRQHGLDPAWAKQLWSNPCYVPLPALAEPPSEAEDAEAPADEDAEATADEDTETPASSAADAAAAAEARAAAEEARRAEAARKAAEALRLEAARKAEAERWSLFITAKYAKDAAAPKPPEYVVGSLQAELTQSKQAQPQEGGRPRKRRRSDAAEGRVSAGGPPQQPQDGAAPPRDVGPKTELVVHKRVGHKQFGATWHDWRSTRLAAVAGGSAMARAGGAAFIGRDVVSVNGEEVDRVADITAVAGPVSEVRFTFQPAPNLDAAPEEQQAVERPAERRPRLSITVPSREGGTAPGPVAPVLRAARPSPLHAAAMP